jgi:hypothetical protein
LDYWVLFTYIKFVLYFVVFSIGCASLIKDQVFLEDNLCLLTYTYSLNIGVNKACQELNFMFIGDWEQFFFFCRYKRVGYLDTDVGQPEFTTPGFLSLTVVDKLTPGICLRVVLSYHMSCSLNSLVSKISFQDLSHLILHYNWYSLSVFFRFPNQIWQFHAWRHQRGMGYWTYCVSYNPFPFQYTDIWDVVSRIYSCIIV